MPVTSSKGVLSWHGIFEKAVSDLCPLPICSPPKSQFQGYPMTIPSFSAWPERDADSKVAQERKGVVPVFVSFLVVRVCTGLDYPISL